MTSIGIYIIFIAVLAGYRSSRYWPSSYKGMAWLGNHLWHLMSMLTGTLLLVITSGWAVGLLTAVCTYITLLSCTIFIVNCNRWIQITGLVLFHLSCIISLILHF